MYTWHGKHYLGAAHGLAGILTLLLQVPLPALRPRLSSLVQPAVDYLLGLQLPSGNLPSSLESSHGDRLVHWCHGAPGFVHLMAHAYRVRKREGVIEGGREYIAVVHMVYPHRCLVIVATWMQLLRVGRWYGRGDCCTRDMVSAMVCRAMPTLSCSSTG